jgi:hypothetical protein
MFKISKSFVICINWANEQPQTASEYFLLRMRDYNHDPVVRSRLMAGQTPDSPQPANLFSHFYSAGHNR